MTTSGTYTFGQSEQIDVHTEAFERIGRAPSQLTSNDLDSARRSLNYLFADWTNQNPNLWEVDLVVLPLIAGQQSYVLDVQTVYITQAATRTTAGGVNTDLVIQPISRAEYLALPNKAQAAQRPTQFYLQRSATPSLFVWPVPQDNGVTLLYYRMKIQQDAGAFTNSLDVPNRFMEAMASGLAAKLAVKFAPERVDMLQSLADRAYAAAIAEDRERVPLRITIDNWGC